MFYILKIVCKVTKNETGTYNMLQIKIKSNINFTTACLKSYESLFGYVSECDSKTIYEVHLKIF